MDYTEVTATDFVPHLLETAARRAEAEGLPLTTQVADAQELPFPDASFDVVLSTFGPTKVAFASLDTAGQEVLARDLMAVWSMRNRAEGALVAPADYVEVVAVRA